jgi:hypothetical protein
VSRLSSAKELAKLVDFGARRVLATPGVTLSSMLDSHFLSKNLMSCFSTVAAATRQYASKFSRKVDPVYAVR